MKRQIEPLTNYFGLPSWIKKRRWYFPLKLANFQSPASIWIILNIVHMWIFYFTRGINRHFWNKNSLKFYFKKISVLFFSLWFGGVDCDSDIQRFFPNWEKRQKVLHLCISLDKQIKTTPKPDLPTDSIKSTPGQKFHKLENEIFKRKLAKFETNNFQGRFFYIKWKYSNPQAVGV